MDALRALPGFRFHPTEEELVGYYLRRRLTGHLSAVERDVIPEADLLMGEPWDLMGLGAKGGAEHGTLVTSASDECFVTGARDECFAFWARGRKYAQGARANRCTVRGYWKSTGSDRAVLSGAREIGMKKTLVFYLGRAPRGTKTDWVMHEFRQTDPKVRAGGADIVVCRVFRKGASKVLEEAAPAAPACFHAGPPTTSTSETAPQRPMPVKGEPTSPGAPRTPSPQRQTSCSSDNQQQREPEHCSAEQSQQRALCWQGTGEGADATAAEEATWTEGASEAESADVSSVEHDVALPAFQEQWELDLEEILMGGSFPMGQGGVCATVRPYAL